MPPQQPLLQHYDDEFSDDDDDPVPDYVAGQTTTSEPEVREWDKFRNLPPPNASNSENSDQYMYITVKILKVVVYFITFSIVMGCGVISKGLVLLMASQLKPGKKVPLCPNEYPNLQREKDYTATLPVSENVAWAWMIFFAYLLPELGSWFRSTRMCIFKKCKRAKFSDLVVVMAFEGLHAAGTAMLFFVVLPDLDVIKGAMLTNCVAFVPGLFGMLSRDKSESNLWWKIMVDVLALACQVSGFFVWPVQEMIKGGPNTGQIWTIPLAVFLTSFGWWENYVDKKAKLPGIKYLGEIKERLYLRSRYFTYMIVSVIKILVFLGVMLVTMSIRLNYNFSALFDLRTAMSSHPINVTENRQVLPENLLPDVSLHDVAPLQIITQIPSTGNSPLHVFLILTLTAYLCYIFGKFACKICIQGFSFAFPVNLTIPASICLLITACGIRTEDVCAFTSMPGYMFWECENGDILTGFLKDDYAWVWLLWLLSQTWITLHIWTPKCERLASTEKLFVSPMYNCLMIDQSLALNRRRDDDPEVKAEEIQARQEEEAMPETSQHYETISLNTDSSNTKDPDAVKSSDYVTRIHACATMWHETDEEMMEMLKSLMRMDEDHNARRIMLKFLNVVDNDYYEFTTHIFFDDAFEISDENEDENTVNRFVRSLVRLIDDAAIHVHQTNIRVRPPKRVPTPYGGRLVWTLPGKTEIIAHLKDKDKIRHKKRWSQVMYMYYLLGFKLMDQNISINRKEIIAENTFLLTLDGDIDFTPKSVALLIDLMKKNTNLGAACGRIHPIGAGFMVWYQKFEYAIGHWLQKATEHMIGCVLCSPGCFSLFRGRALMDDNVMSKYTTVSNQARHYVQYDQGEDRWLCTLLLQRGYRVEYCAASDAYTQCPEGFGEFFNQRRRWVPSTMANIMDLLQDYKRTIKINDNISLPYIGYQSMLMAGTILGPGTIFLMLVGAFVAAFNIGNWRSFEYNIIPIVMFMVVCFFANSYQQIRFALLLSTAYALVMCLVVVAMIMQIVDEGLITPSGLFLVAMAASFIITAIMHPKEFWCLPCGFIYYLLVPSMYLLLIIYSLFNLNDVSWGTREVKTKKTKKEQEAEKKALEEAEKKRKQNSLLGMLQRSQQQEDEGSIEFSLAGLFKIMCCVHPKPNDMNVVMTSIMEIKKKLEEVDSHLGGGRRRSTHHHRVSIKSDATAVVTEDDADATESVTSEETTEPKGEKRNDLVNPYWIEDTKAVRKGQVTFLHEKEVRFWKDIIEKYLHPLVKKDGDQKKMAEALRDLRNMSVFSFMMLNAIFVIIVFLLQLNKDKIHINWPLGIKTNITYDQTTDEIHISKEYLQLEPIGLVFVFFFALILIIQFVAMLFHRFGTISHILASTTLSCGAEDDDDSKTDTLKGDERGLQIVRQMQKLQGINGEYEQFGELTDKAGRRRTIANISRARNQSIGTLDVAFKKRWLKISPEDEHDHDRRRETMRALVENPNWDTKDRTIDIPKLSKSIEAHRASMARGSLAHARPRGSLSRPRRKASFAAAPTIIEEAV